MSKNPKLYYTAGELADLFELPKQTLLYYDKMGVLSRNSFLKTTIAIIPSNSIYYWKSS